jgi:hypothetical protein
MARRSVKAMASYRRGGKVYLSPLVRRIALIGVSKEAVLSARTHSGNRVIGRRQSEPLSDPSSAGLRWEAADIRLANPLGPGLMRLS